MAKAAGGAGTVSRFYAVLLEKFALLSLSFTPRGRLAGNLTFISKDDFATGGSQPYN